MRCANLRSANVAMQGLAYASDSMTKLPQQREMGNSQGACSVNSVLHELSLHAQLMSVYHAKDKLPWRAGINERQSACVEISVTLLIGMGSLCLGCSCLTLEAEVLNIAPQLADHTVSFLRNRPRQNVGPKHEAGKCNDFMHQKGKAA